MVRRHASNAHAVLRPPRCSCASMAQRPWRCYDATLSFDNRGDATTEAQLLRRCRDNVFHGHGSVETTCMTTSMMLRRPRRCRPGCSSDGAVACSKVAESRIACEGVWCGVRNIDFINFLIPNETSTHDQSYDVLVFVRSHV